MDEKEKTFLSPSITVTPYGMTAYDEEGKKVMEEFLKANKHRIRTFSFEERIPSRKKRFDKS